MRNAEVKCSKCSDHFENEVPDDLEIGDLYPVYCDVCEEEIDVLIVDWA